jgi:hypothetical protein
MAMQMTFNPSDVGSNLTGLISSVFMLNFLSGVYCLSGFLILELDTTEYLTIALNKLYIINKINIYILDIFVYSSE